MYQPNPDVSVSLYLDKRRVIDRVLYPVTLRVTHFRTSRFYVLKGFKFTEKEYVRLFSRKATRAEKAIRLKMEEEVSRAQEIVDNMNNGFSFDAFKRLLRADKDNAIRPQTVQDYFRLKISLSKYSTGKTYTSVMNSVISYDPRVSFHKITSTWLKRYEKWILKSGNTYTTVGVYMRHLRHIVNMAIDDGVIKMSPFGAKKGLYQIPSSKPSHRALTKEQISILYKYTSDSPQENYYLKYFLFSYFCSGMNMIDIANLKYQDIEKDYFTFVRRKTRDTSKNVPEARIFMSPPVKQIIAEIGVKSTMPGDFIFPILTRGMSEEEEYRVVRQHIKQVNKYIKRIARKLDIEENITTYWARHTFSTVSLLEGAPLEYISEQLTHQNITTTTTYIDSFKDDHRKEYTQKLLVD